jgi:hypothetical protein
MLWAACASLWLALIVSFAVSASIVGVPAVVIAFEIVRWTASIGVAIGLVVLTRAALHERRQTQRDKTAA